LNRVASPFFSRRQLIAWAVCCNKLFGSFTLWNPKRAASSYLLLSHFFVHAGNPITEGNPITVQGLGHDFLSGPQAQMFAVNEFPVQSGRAPIPVAS